MPSWNRPLQPGHRSDGGLDFYQRRDIVASAQQSGGAFPAVRLTQSDARARLVARERRHVQVGTKHQTIGK